MKGPVAKMKRNDAEKLTEWIRSQEGTEHGEDQLIIWGRISGPAGEAETYLDNSPLFRIYKDDDGFTIVHPMGYTAGRHIDASISDDRLMIGIGDRTDGRIVVRHRIFADIE